LQSLHGVFVGGVDALDQRRDIGAGHWVDADARFLGIRNEFRILHRGVERLSQRGDAIGRNPWRNHVGPPRCLRRQQQIERLLLLLICILHDERHVRQPLVLFAADLHDHVHEAVVGLEPVRFERLNRAVRGADIALGFTALEREEIAARSLMSADDLDLGSEHVVEHGRIHHAVAGRRRSRFDHLLFKELIERFQAAIRAADGDRYGGIGAADPVEFLRVEFELVLFFRHGLEERRSDQRAVDRADRGSVLGCDVVNVVRCLEAAGAGHILRHDGWLAGDVIAEMPSQRARVDVIAGPRRIADDEADIFIVVEVGHGLCREQGRGH
jgi:hypothetical protein